MYQAQEIEHGNQGDQPTPALGSLCVNQTKGTEMEHAINILKIALETMETNEVINRKEGNAEQANLEALTAIDIRRALLAIDMQLAGDTVVGE